MYAFEQVSCVPSQVGWVGVALLALWHQMHMAAVLHLAKVSIKSVDLKTSSIGQYFSAQISLASNGFQTTLTSLTASHKGRSPAKVLGQLSVIDPVTPNGPVTVLIKLTAPLEKTTTKRVQLNLGEFTKVVSSLQKQLLQSFVTSFGAQHREEIRSLLKSA